MMVLRTVFLLGCTALAYALLRGWPESLPGVMKACFAVLAWVAGLGVWAKREAGKSGTAARARSSPRWLDYVGIGMAILAVESGFLWLLGAAPGPLEQAGLAIERQFRPQAAAIRVMNNRQSATRPGNWLWTHETRRPLPKRTDFKPGMKPEVFIRLADRADAETLLKTRVYVRSFALGRYENAAWAPLTDKSLEIHADDTGFVKLAPPGPGRPIRHEVFHAADAGGQNALTALHGASAARVSPLTRIDDGLFLLPPSETVGGYQYEAISSPMRIEDLPDGGLVSGWPGRTGLIARGARDRGSRSPAAGARKARGGHGTGETTTRPAPGFPPRHAGLLARHVEFAGPRSDRKFPLRGETRALRILCHRRGVDGARARAAVARRLWLGRRHLV
jgi:hypothetical protein